MMKTLLRQAPSKRTQTILLEIEKLKMLILLSVYVELNLKPLFKNVVCTFLCTTYYQIYIVN